jgi:hypothetical protein
LLNFKLWSRPRQRRGEGKGEAEATPRRRKCIFMQFAEATLRQKYRGRGNAEAMGMLPPPRLSHRVCILFMYFLCFGVASVNYIVMYSIYVFYCLGFASAVLPPPRHCLGIFHCILAIESNSSASALPRPASSYVFLPPRRCLGELYCIFAI